MPRDLVERFIEVNGRTTARRTVVLIGAFVLPGHITGAVVTELTLTRQPFVDATGIRVGVWGFVALCALATFVAWRVGRTGADGWWLFYVFAVPYVLLAALLAYEFGVQSSPVVAWWPVIILVSTAWFGARAGLFAFLYGAVLYGALFAISATDLVPYAPAFLGRSLDQQQATGYVTLMVALILVYVAVGCANVLLSAKARELAERRLDAAHRQLDEAAHLIARYVPAEVARGILAGEADVDGHHRRKLTVFFSDLVGFSDIAEELEPEDLALVVNEYFTEMTAIARRHAGTVDELQGDALLILFGAPDRTTDRDQALRAVAMASEMHAAMVGLNAGWRRQGITEELTVRMGINTGVVTVGNFGSVDRMKYAALGKHVNLAARLQAIATPGRTVLSHSTYLLVSDEVECRPLGAQQLKGIHKPVEAFEVC